MDLLDKLTLEMIAFDAGDARRIQHFLKVHAFARLIASGEAMEARARFTLEAAALTHDIGILPAERAYGRCDGKLQEQMGPPHAEEMLKRLGFPPEVVARVCYLIAHHHTYQNVDGLDYRILLEADFLVNLFEDGCGKDAIDAAEESVFRTGTGRRLLRELFPAK